MLNEGARQERGRTTRRARTIDNDKSGFLWMMERNVRAVRAGAAGVERINAMRATVKGVCMAMWIAEKDQV